jgi:hypothetical protein
MIGWTVLVAGCSTGVPLRMDMQGNDTRLDPTCQVLDWAKSELALDDGSPVYVEPESVSVDDARTLLLLGLPTYVTRGGSAARNDILGVRIGEGGSVTEIPRPVTSRHLSNVRAVSLGADRWAVFFMEHEPKDDFPRPLYASRVWHGVLEGATWTSIDTLPVPPGAQVQTANASRVVRTRTGLKWAVLARRGHTGVAVLYHSVEDGWLADPIEARGVAYVDLVAGEHSDTMFAVVVKPDPAALADQNSLFLYRHVDRWEAIRKVARGGDEPIHLPTLERTGTGINLTWEALVSMPDGSQRSEVRTVTDVFRVEVEVVEPEVVFPTRTPVAPGGPMRWVTASAIAGGERVLRVLGSSSSGATELGALAYPFRGPFGAAGVDAEEIVISGPFFGEAMAYLTSLLVRVRTSCMS